MPVPKPTKAVVTVAEMARMVGLSRARFYQLVGTAFPHPVYDVNTRRPLYVEEQQEVCLEVRRRNCGVDGKPVLFYARRVGVGAPRASTPAPKSASVSTATAKKAVARPDPILESVRLLGLSMATAAQVQAAITELFPGGINSTDHGQVVREVFLRLKRRNPADSAG
jgi:hypothetical protein